MKMSIHEMVIRAHKCIEDEFIGNRITFRQWYMLRIMITDFHLNHAIVTLKLL